MQLINSYKHKYKMKKDKLYIYYLDQIILLHKLLK